MTVWIKQGVMGDLSREMQKAQGRMVNLYASKGLDFFITSVRESNHSGGSFHYIGMALDFKRQGVSMQEIDAALGAGFDVIEYTDARDIFHVEHDPK
jgi:hypothetical protein